MGISFDCSNDKENSFGLKDVEKNYILKLFEGKDPANCDAEEILETGFRALAVLEQFSEFKDCCTFLFKLDDETFLVIVENRNDCLIRKFLFSIYPEKKVPVVVIKKKETKSSVEMN